MVALALVVVIGLASLATPATSGGYLARLTNSINTTGTATYFKCTNAVIADAGGAAFAYRLNEATGSYYAGDYSPVGAHGIYRGQMSSDTTTVPACPRDPGGAYTLNGTTSYISTPKLLAGPKVFSVEVWFKTTTAGGKLIGFGNSQTGSSTSYDRHVFMNNAGQIVFGVYPGTVKTITSPGSYADGKWHHTVATLSAAGMNLYLDGQKVAGDPATTTAGTYNGYWRIGYDNLAGWGTNEPTRYSFTGSMRFAAAYTTALTATQIRTHYNAGRP